MQMRCKHALQGFCQELARLVVLCSTPRAGDVIVGAVAVLELAVPAKPTCMCSGPPRRKHGKSKGKGAQTRRKHKYTVTSHIRVNGLEDLPAPLPVNWVARHLVQDKQGLRRLRGERVAHLLQQGTHTRANDMGEKRDRGGDEGSRQDQESSKRCVPLTQAQGHSRRWT